MARNTLSALFVLPLAVSLFAALPGAVFAAPPDWAPDRLLVQPRAGVSDAQASREFADQGAEIVDLIPAVDTFVLHVPAARLATIEKALARSPRFKSVGRDYLRYLQTTPNDYWYPSQWHLTKIQAPNAWGVTTGSTGVTIAVIDSGVSAVNDLSSKLLPGINLIDGGTDVTDGFNHGTPVAGIAGASTNNGTGVAGISWLSSILPVKVYGNTGATTCSAITNGIIWAADHGAKVINMSFAGPTACSGESSAIDYAWNRGAVLVAAAGNDGTTTPTYPAAYNNVIAVASTESDDSLSSFSNRGNWLSVAAPGRGLYTTYNNGAYTGASGTSAAAPVVSGIAALVLSANPALTNAQVTSIIEQSADDLGVAGFDSSFGWGRVNAYRAVVAATGSTIPAPDTLPPTASISSPLPGATLAGTATVSVSASDDVGVAKVDLYIDGAVFRTDTVAPFSFSWDTSTSANGAHTLRAVASDATGNAGSSADVSVTVNNVSTDSTPPSAVITSPAGGSKIGKSVQIKVSATDEVLVQRVDVSVDGALVGSASCSSSTCSVSIAWNPRKAATGAHILSAAAYDGAGNVGRSPLVTIYK
jgi:subtilisin family serine protease